MECRVYRYTADRDGYMGVEFLGLDREELFFRHLRCGHAVDVQRWDVPDLPWEEPAGRAKGDFPAFSPSPVFSRQAWDVMAPFLGAEVQPLSTKIGGELYVLVNVISIVDALDIAKSMVYYLPDGNIGGVSKYAFRRDTLVGHHMFVIPETKGYEVLVSEEFRKVVEENGLRGLLFSQVLG